MCWADLDAASDRSSNSAAVLFPADLARPHCSSAADASRSAVEKLQPLRFQGTATQRFVVGSHSGFADGQSPLSVALHAAPREYPLHESRLERCR